MGMCLILATLCTQSVLNKYLPLDMGHRQSQASGLPVPLTHLRQVDDLKAKLAIQEAELKQKNENADKLIHVVGVETEKVSKEKAIADEEEAKVEVINKVGRRTAETVQTSRTPREGTPAPSTGPPAQQRAPLPGPGSSLSGSW